MTETGSVQTPEPIGPFTFASQLFLGTYFEATSDMDPFDQIQLMFRINQERPDSTPVTFWRLAQGLRSELQALSEWRATAAASSETPSAIRRHPWNSQGQQPEPDDAAEATADEEELNRRAEEIDRLCFDLENHLSGPPAVFRSKLKIIVARFEEIASAYSQNVEPPATAAKELLETSDDATELTPADRAERAGQLASGAAKWGRLSTAYTGFGARLSTLVANLRSLDSVAALNPALLDPGAPDTTTAIRQLYIARLVNDNGQLATVADYCSFIDANSEQLVTLASLAQSLRQKGNTAGSVNASFAATGRLAGIALSPDVNAKADEILAGPSGPGLTVPDQFNRLTDGLAELRSGL